MKNFIAGGRQGEVPSQMQASEKSGGNGGCCDQFTSQTVEIHNAWKINGRHRVVGEYATDALVIFPKIIKPKNNFPHIFFVPYLGGEIQRKISIFLRTRWAGNIHTPPYSGIHTGTLTHTTHRDTLRQTQTEEKRVDLFMAGPRVPKQKGKA